MRVRALALVEAVGVLAVVVVLAMLVVPKLMAAVAAERLEQVAAEYSALRSAAIACFERSANLGSAVHGSLFDGSIERWDVAVLVPQGLLERPFEPRLAGNIQVRVVGALGADARIEADNAAYDLDGEPTPDRNDALGTYVVECVLEGMDRVEAWELSRRIDGPTCSASGPTVHEDFLGRVKYTIDDVKGTVRLFVACR